MNAVPLALHYSFTAEPTRRYFKVKVGLGSGLELRDMIRTLFKF